MPTTQASESTSSSTLLEFCCRRRVVRGVAHVVPTGELDIGAVPEVASALRDAQTHAGRIVLDLRGVDFIDSSGMHLVVSTARRLRATGRRFVVVRGSAEVDWLFAVTGIDRDLELVTQPPTA